MNNISSPTENAKPATKAKIRKIAVFVEETLTEMDRAVTPPTRRAAAAAVTQPAATANSVPN